MRTLPLLLAVSTALLFSTTLAVPVTPYGQTAARFGNTADGTLADTTDSNDFGIASNTAEDQIAAAQERARLSVEAVRLHNEALMRDNNDRVAVINSRNQELLAKLNSPYKPVPVTPPPAAATAVVEPVATATAVAPEPVAAIPQQQQTIATAAAPQQPAIAESRPQSYIATDYKEFERPIEGNAYTTGVRTSSAPAFVEVQGTKRIAGRRITESRLLYKPVYEEQRDSLQMPNNIHGEVFVVGDPRLGRIVGEGEAAPGTPINSPAFARASGWTTLDQQSHRNEVDDGKMYTTGVRVSHAPVAIEVPIAKRIAARRVTTSRIVYRPVLQQLKSHFEHPKDLGNGAFIVKADEARIMDAGPQDHAPIEEAYFQGGRLTPVTGGSTSSSSGYTFSSAPTIINAPATTSMGDGGYETAATETTNFEPVDTDMSTTNIEQPAVAYDSGIGSHGWSENGGQSAFRPLAQQTGDRYLQFPSMSELKSLVTPPAHDAPLVNQQSTNPLSTWWKGNTDFLQNQLLENQAHNNQQARENMAYLNEQIRTQHLKNIGAIPKEPATVGGPINADFLGWGDIARKQNAFVSNENRLNQKFVGNEAAANQAVAQGAPMTAAHTTDGAFKKS